MYACTSSKFDHPYQGEGIVGLSSKGLLAKMTDAHVQNHVCVHYREKHQSWKLQRQLIVLLKQTPAKKKKKRFRQNPWPPHQQNLAALSWGIQISRSLSVTRPEWDGDNEIGPVRKKHPPGRQAESIADLAVARKRETVKTQQRDSTGACAAVPLRSIFNASNSTSAKGMHNYRFLNNSWGAH